MSRSNSVHYPAYLSETLGTLILLAVVVGSGIMGEQLAQGNTAVALLANSLATGCALFVLITLFGPLSGAHFNPVVTLLSAWQKQLTWSQVPGYLIGQVVGALLGVALAHGMFDLALIQQSTHIRTGGPQWLGEITATAGLILVIQCIATRGKLELTAACVALYITAAYWFTSSTSFANPAVTLARSFTNTFAGIAPSDVAGFVMAQLIGAGVGGGLARCLHGGKQ
ncbi:aquaporin [Parvibium lacunae]|uniref:Aquaporin family protein n=1 Tax=Parvibium lacunae TaxID=1888893 RepID=A0A368L3H0_9BURK|nr:MIP/aquaporin family protein [Parvibium lacunae]RCS58119.1 aquaporin family protein [Parvibium lacunae]